MIRRQMLPNFNYSGKKNNNTKLHLLLKVTGFIKIEFVSLKDAI